MKKRTRSILEELNNLHLHKDKESLIESTGNNLIQSTINLFNRINEQYDSESALELERRFLNSIRTGDPKKFKRGIEKIKESRKNVHAFIVGECPSLELWSWLRDIKMGGNPTTKVFYNPYKYSTFVDKDGNPVHKARAVLVNTNYIQADLN